MNILCNQVRCLTIENEEEEEEEGPTFTNEENLALEVDQVVFGLKTKALAWLRDLDQRVISNHANSVKSRLKVSRISKSSRSKSSSSSTKSTKERMVEEVTKLAALKVNAEFALKLAALKSQRDIAEAEAKLDAYYKFVKHDDSIPVVSTN